MAEQVRQFQKVARILLNRLIRSDKSDWWEIIQRFQDELQLTWESQFPDQCPQRDWQIFGLNRHQNDDHLTIEIRYWDCESGRRCRRLICSLDEMTRADAEAWPARSGTRIEESGNRYFMTKKGQEPRTKAEAIAALESLIESADSFPDANGKTKRKAKPKANPDKELDESQEIEILERWKYESGQNKNLTPAEKMTREEFAKSCNISLDQFGRIQDKHRKTPRN